MAPTISNIKYLLREYKKRFLACIWCDALGVHFREHYWDVVTVGEVKWLRYKGIR